MNTTFDPATSYGEDWLFYDFVEHGTHHIRGANGESDTSYDCHVCFDDKTVQEISQAAIGLVSSRNDVTAIFWRGDILENPDPKPGDLIQLQRESEVPEYHSIDRVHKSQSGLSLISTQQVREDVE